MGQVLGVGSTEFPVLWFASEASRIRRRSRELVYGSTRYLSAALSHNPFPNMINRFSPSKMNIPDIYHCGGRGWRIYDYRDFEPQP